jgi:plasmid stability protein
MEAEARIILADAVAGDRNQPEPNLADAIRRRFAPLGGVDLEQHRYLNMDDLREHKKEALRRAA